mmetsp:Transcript_64106/g.119196  ORF Transcript_64106/g.119196 Transcript_64106/m.119196 type:complete len:136 (+) Transcript_64106:78-485(+)
MGLPDWQLVDSHLIPDGHPLRCLVCFDVLLDPMECPKCQTLVCRACSDQWKNYKVTCPSCRADSVTMQQVAHRAIRAQLDGLLVRCPNRRCAWIGRFDQRAGHTCHPKVGDQGYVSDFLTWLKGCRFCQNCAGPR